MLRLLQSKKEPFFLLKKSFLRKRGIGRENKKRRSDDGS